MPLSSTHDLDARFAVFLNPIKDLTKNWEVDISKYLEEYLEELAEVRITFDGGETVMNFAEAAMLIQGSAAVYSKKVEFLWQMVLQMLDLLSGSRNYNASQSEINNEQSPHKTSKANINTSLEFDKVNISNGRNINMREEDADISDNIGFKILPQIPLHLIDKEGEKSTMRICLCLKNMEVFGNKEDYRINRCYLAPSGLLCLDLPQELLNTREKNVVDFANTSIAGFHTQEESIAVQPEYKSKPPEEVQDLVPIEEEPDLGDFEPINDGCEINNEDSFSNVKEAVDVPSTKEETVTRSSNRRVAMQQNKEEFSTPLKPLDPHEETPAKRPFRIGRIRKPLHCSCCTPTPKKSKRRKVDGEKKCAKKLPMVDSYIEMELAKLVKNNNSNMPNEMLKSPLMEEIALQESKRLDIEKGRKSMKIAEVQNDKEIGFAAPELNNDYDDMNDSVHNDVDLPDPHKDFDLPESVMGTVEPRKALNDTLLYETASDYEALVQKWVSDYVSSAQEHVSSTDLTKRVNTWRKKISPILEDEENRPAFDIHTYGSHVLTYFPKGNSTNTCLFEDIARGEEPKEVSRIFLSCLMLANTYNLELTNYKNGPLDMDCVQLKLLSRARHHKQLEQYAAPSKVNHSPIRRKIVKRKSVVESSSSDEEIIVKR